MSDRYTVHPHPGIVGGVYLRDNDEMSESGPLTPAEARRLAHALLDAIGERDEAEAIVRAFAEVEPRDESSIRHRCHYCAAWAWGDGKTPPTLAHDPDCPYLRAHAFVAREGREETDHG